MKKKERLYQSLFPPFNTTHRHTIYFINRFMSSNDMMYLLEVVQHTDKFVFDTEKDYRSNFPSLIQILFLHSPDEDSQMILIETKYLPEVSSLLFRQIQDLFSFILRPKAFLYCWGSLINELSSFLDFQIFSFPIFSFIQDTQIVFATWFNDLLNKHSDDNDCYNDGHDVALIVNAPPIDPQLFLPAPVMNEIKLCKKELWGLQDAVIYLFYEYLSKKETLQTWSNGLDSRVQYSRRIISHEDRQKLVRDACNDCLSLGQIILLMIKSNILSAFVRVKYDMVAGEYLSINSSVFLNIDLGNTEVEDGHVLDDQIPIVNDNHSSPVQSTNDVLLPRVKINRRSLLAKQERNKKSSLRHRKKRYKYEVIRSTRIFRETVVKNKLRQYGIKFRNVNIVGSRLYIDLHTKQLQTRYERMIPMDFFI